MKEVLFLDRPLRTSHHNVWSQGHCCVLLSVLLCVSREETSEVATSCLISSALPGLWKSDADLSTRGSVSPPAAALSSSPSSLSLHPSSPKTGHSILFYAEDSVGWWGTVAEQRWGTT